MDLPKPNAVGIQRSDRDRERRDLEINVDGTVEPPSRDLSAIAGIEIPSPHVVEVEEQSRSGDH